jgi:spore coat polysaccharide biosynthesis predicted glycosyltransferase SpsG
MKILCYCEADSRTGFGHYSRIRNLQKILNKNFHYSIITKNTELAKKIFKKNKIIKLKNDIFSFLKNNASKYSIIILDPPYYPNKKNSNFDIKFKNFFKNKKKTKIVIFTDETKASPKYCDLLINDYPGSNKFCKFYKKFNSKIKLNLGINAFLYPKCCFVEKKYKKKYDLFVAFGGSDSKNLLNKFFKEIINISGKKVLLTNLETYNKIKKFKNKNLTIKKICDYNNYLRYLSGSRFYISTPSNIMFEAYGLNIKGIVIPTQDRQHKMGRYFHNIGLVKCLSLYKSLNKNQIYKNFNDLKLANSGARIIFAKKKAYKSNLKIIKGIESLI